MPFVKLDCGILNSTLWFERVAREVFITSLLMAEPCELTEETPQLAVDSLSETGWRVPPGWYGFVPAAGVGILHRAGVEPAEGIEALRMLGSPEASSRSPEFDGRRLVRVDGGYIVLNYMKYRERDYTSAERQRRYREKKALRRDVYELHRNITQAEAEAEAEVQEERTRTESAEPQDGSSLPVLTFQTIGTKGRRWDLSQQQVNLWVAAYPGLDVMAECRKALAWVQANLSRRKTAKGMPRYLVNWLNRATDSGRPTTSRVASRRPAWAVETKQQGG